MSVIAVAVKHMMAAGMDSAAICAAVAEMEASTDKRSTGAKRQARYRERREASQSVTNRNKASQGVTNVTKTSPLVPPLKAPPDPLKITPPIIPPTPLEGARAKSNFPPPDGVTPEQFSAFRKQRKKALTDHAYTLLCNKLRRLAEAGWPPGDMIDLAIERGWETVFEPKEAKPNGYRNSTGTRTNPIFTARRRLGIDG